MINIARPEDCCGCTACKYICPKDAIDMTADSLGFKYPVIDNNKCIHCGLCERVCAFKDDYDQTLNLKNPIVIGARHINKDEVKTSRSGAAFSALCYHVISNGGVVYGAAFSDDFEVIHKRAVTIEECRAFKGSKYVESNLEETFSNVKDDLKVGKLVLFSGTPCQTAGLNSFIGKHLRKNLLLVDILCHGVPSPFVWRDYIKYVEKTAKGKIVEANFRDKRICGWSAHKESFRMSDDRLIVRRSYSDLFYKHIMFRRSCGNCHYCNTVRPSDITLGDFWGWEQAGITVNADDRGLSLLLVNTEKGLMYLKKIEKNLTLYPTSLESCMQPSLQYHLVISDARDKFENIYARRGFTSAARHFQTIGLPFMLRRFREKSSTAFKLLIKRVTK